MATPAEKSATYIFLSYASADRERALEIADRLEAKGISVWLDRKSIAGGTSWSAEIVRGIKGCAALVIACSPAAAASPNVQQEIQLAWQSRRPMLPLLLEPTRFPEVMEYALAGRQWIEVLERPEEAWLPWALRALSGLGISPPVAPPPLESSSSSEAPFAREPTPRHNLPAQLTSFVGRETQLAEVERRLAATRLLTLTGTGGCGKTRLALQVGERVVEAYPEGIWLVDLAPLATAALVPDAVAAVLGVRGFPGQSIEATLLSFLRARQLLMILDNCEHLIEACARLAEVILRSCPRVRILATSREALGIPGEVSWRIPSLSLPPVDQPATLSEVATSEAVSLFVDRATAVQPTFCLTEENASIVVQICRRLDGIPLALELAATRLKTLSVQHIAERLDQRFRLLTGGSRTALPRQQTLAALVDWSYDLLSEPEQTLFNRLSVFAGGWTLDAVEGVGDDIDVADQLGGLVDKSLVVADSGAAGVERYHLLETLRQYGRERLLATGEAETTQSRHAAYYHDLAVKVEPHLFQADDIAYLAQLDPEIDNLRTALQWFLDHQVGDAGLQILKGLERFWWTRARVVEMRRWVEQFLSLPAATEPSILRARVLIWFAAMTNLQGDLVTGRPLMDEAVAAARATGDRQTIAIALGWLVGYHGESDVARAAIEESLAIFRQLGDRWWVSWTLSALGLRAFWAGDTVKARALLSESLAVARSLGNRQRVADVLEVLGQVATSDNEEEARAYLHESLALYREVGDQTGVASDDNFLGWLDLRQQHFETAREHFRLSLRMTRHWLYRERITQSLAGLALVAAGLGEPERALRLASASSWERASHVSRFSPVEVAELENGLGRVREALGESATANAWAEGQAMTMEQAITYALADDSA